MKQTRLIMGMPITIEIAAQANSADFTAVFDYFRAVDRRFSPYIKTSEVSQVNQGLAPKHWSKDMKSVMRLCQQAERLSRGYFNPTKSGYFDPSGLVKGWAIKKAASMLRDKGYTNIYIEAGGDIALSGHSPLNQPWRVGIRNPFNIKEIIKVVALDSGAVATSGTYI